MVYACASLPATHGGALDIEGRTSVLNSFDTSSNIGNDQESHNNANDGIYQDVNSTKRAAQEFNKLTYHDSEVDFDVSPCCVLENKQKNISSKICHQNAINFQSIEEDSERISDFACEHKQDKNRSKPTVALQSNSSSRAYKSTQVRNTQISFSLPYWHQSANAVYRDLLRRHILIQI